MRKADSLLKDNIATLSSSSKNLKINVSTLTKLALVQLERAEYDKAGKNIDEALNLL